MRIRELQDLPVLQEGRAGTKLMRLLASSDLPEDVLGEQPSLHEAKSMRLVIDEDKINRQRQK